MVEMQVDYQGDLTCRVVHGPSGTVLLTDAPVDNQGKGRYFSPTDLLATALGTCIFTVMGIIARRNNIDLTGATMTLRKEMASQPVRRIGHLHVDIRMPRAISEADRCRLEHAANACPVKQSLHPDTDVQIRFDWSV